MLLFAALGLVFPLAGTAGLTIAGDAIHLDFTGTDPQVGSALNIASHGVTHPFLCQAINAYLVTELVPGESRVGKAVDELTRKSEDIRDDVAQAVANLENEGNPPAAVRPFPALGSS